MQQSGGLLPATARCRRTLIFAHTWAKMQTNLASSSKTLDSLRESRVISLSQGSFMTSSLTGEISLRDEVIFMQKIIMPAEETKNFLEVFEMFVTSQTAKGVADVMEERP